MTWVVFDGLPVRFVIVTNWGEAGIASLVRSPGAQPGQQGEGIRGGECNRSNAADTLALQLLMKCLQGFRGSRAGLD